MPPQRATEGGWHWIGKFIRGRVLTHLIRQYGPRTFHIPGQVASGEDAERTKSQSCLQEAHHWQDQMVFQVQGSESKPSTREGLFHKYGQGASGDSLSFQTCAFGWLQQWSPCFLIPAWTLGALWLSLFSLETGPENAFCEGEGESQMRGNPSTQSEKPAYPSQGKACNGGAEPDAICATGPRFCHPHP